MEAGETEDAAKHLNYLSSSARRLSALVDMMSQYTLLNKKIEPELVRVGSVVDGVIESLGTYIQERKGEVRVVGDSFIIGNGVFLHQVLQNLIVNGFKYNGSYKPEVVITTTSEATMCVIRVADNGIGIARDYIEQVFQPLARLHTSSEYSGTGLGLTMARKAAAAQGGTIFCQSELGVGSEFVVRYLSPFLLRTLQPRLYRSAPRFPTLPEIPGYCCPASAAGLDGLLLPLQAGEPSRRERENQRRPPFRTACAR